MPASAIHAFAGSASRSRRALRRHRRGCRAASLRARNEPRLRRQARRLRLGGALAFIVLSALSAAQARSDPLAEAYVLGLICVSTIGLVVGAGASAQGRHPIRADAHASANERRDFEQSVDATLTNVLKLIQEHVAEGAKFHDSLTGADRKAVAQRFL